MALKLSLRFFLLLTVVAAIISYFAIWTRCQGLSLTLPGVVVFLPALVWDRLTIWRVTLILVASFFTGFLSSMIEKWIYPPEIELYVMYIYPLINGVGSGSFFFALTYLFRSRLRRLVFVEANSVGDKEQTGSPDV